MSILDNSAHSLEEIVAINWWDRFPEIGRGNVPVEIYTSPEIFEREKAVFRRCWQQVARVEEIPNPGDYVVIDMGFLKANVIISRGGDGRIHAVHNVCPHRGNQVLFESHGNAEVFECGYHGWTFKPDGEASHIPDWESFVGVTRECASLRRIHVDQWQGFIFINLLEQPEQTLLEYLGTEFTEGYDGYPFDAASQSSYWWTMDVNANWKLVRDGFIEAYHVSVVHDRSLPNTSWGPRNPYSHWINCELLGNHGRLAVAGNPDYVPSLMGGLSYMQPSTMPEFELPKGLNPTRSEFWVQDITIVFPSFSLYPSLGQLFGAYYTYNFWPVAIDRTIITHKLYFSKPRTAAQRAAQEYGKVLQREAVMEDFLLIERQQKAVESHAVKDFPLSAQEMLLRHQYEVMDREIARVDAGKEARS